MHLAIGVLVSLLGLTICVRGAVFMPPHKWTRDEAFACTKYYTDGIIDGVRDGIVTREEVDRARHDGLGWKRFFAAFTKYTTDKVFRDCDADGDGVLTEHDNHPPTCMETKFEVDNAVWYVCRALSKPGDKYYDLLHDRVRADAAT